MASKACLGIVCIFAVINYAVGQCMQQWEWLPDTHSSNGVYQATGDASFGACVLVCTADNTCKFLDYDFRSSPNNNQRCHTFDTIKPIGSLIGVSQLRKGEYTCHKQTYFSLIGNTPGGCQVYRHHNYQGLPVVFYASTTVADSSACLEACFNDINCRSAWFDTSNSMCMRYDTTYGNQVIFAQGSDYYDFNPCDERNPKETGFFLYAANLMAPGGTTQNAITTFPGCWERCLKDWNCVGFDWTGTTTCVTHTAATVNSTQAANGYYHHRYIESKEFSASFVPVAAPTNLPTNPSGRCLQAIVYVNQRSFGATLVPQANGNIEDCIEYCRNQGSSVCAAIDWERKQRPFKGIKCYTFPTAPASRIAVVERDQVVFTSHNCPADSGTPSTAHGCQWVEFPNHAGILPALSGTASTTTTLSSCQAECAANRDCWGIDWTASSTSCVYYDTTAAIWFTPASGTSRYLRENCA